VGIIAAEIRQALLHLLLLLQVLLLVMVVGVAGGGGNKVLQKGVKHLSLHTHTLLP